MVLAESLSSAGLRERQTVVAVLKAPEADVPPVSLGQEA